MMSVMRSLAAAATVALVASAAAAGTSFRLEIGSSAALGMDKKFKDGKKIVVAVRAVACEELAAVKVAATAEGLVDGKRQTLPITMMAVDPGEAIYAIQQQWPQQGTWVLHLKASCPRPNSEASTLVAVSKGTFLREKSVVLREPATRQQLEEALADLARSQS